MGPVVWIQSSRAGVADLGHVFILLRNVHRIARQVSRLMTRGEGREEAVFAYSRSLDHSLNRYIYHVGTSDV